jgi:hypothetical protein
VDLVLSAALNGSDGLPAVRYPVAYVDFLRTCIERTAHLVREVRGDAGAPERAGNRFAMLVRHLRLDLPTIDFSVAQEIALIADRNRSVSEPKEFGQWAGDIGLHFQSSSSFGRKGRVLFNVVRFARSEHCLELGTAYGMSALFILAALKAYAKSGHLDIRWEETPRYMQVKLVRMRDGKRLSVIPGLSEPLRSTIRLACYC